VLTATPETYNLPRARSRPAERVGPSLASGFATVAGFALASLAFFATRPRGPAMIDSAVLSIRVANEADVFYFGLPSVKPSLWSGLVSGYMFIAGVGGSAQVIATAADLVGDRALSPIVRNGRYIALVLRFWAARC
jgi:hypothetical protein